MPNWEALVRDRLRAEPAVVAEVAQQLEQVYADARAEGLSEPDARARAEAQVADWSALARDVADARAPLAPPVPLRARLALGAAGVSGDARQALRGLIRAGGFALTAIATLGLGIALCVSMFDLANVLVLRPLPCPDPQRVMALLESSRQFPQMGVAWPDFQDWVASNHSFEELAATRGTVQVLAHLGSAPAVMVTGLRVTSGYFPIFGAQPVLGRTILPSDDRAGAVDVVVVSWSFFQTRLGGDRGWLGRTVDMDGQPRTVVGVMPPGFPNLPTSGSPDFWQPLAPFIAQNAPFQRRGNHAGILVLGRLRPGVSQAQAERDMNVLMGALGQQFAATNGGVQAAIQPYRDLLEGDFRQPLLLLLAASGLVLLIACLNVVNLVLARAFQRERERSIRLALGASRARLVRGQLIEAFLLSLGGAAVGLGLAATALRIVSPLLPALGLPTQPLGLDGDVFVFSAAVVVACALICGLGPALLGRTRGDPMLLHNRTAGGAFGRRRAGKILVAAEVLGSVVLLIGSGLVIHSLLRLQDVRYGFEPQGRLSFIIGLTAQYPTPEQKLNFFREAQRRFAATPGVAAAGGVFPLPLIGYNVEDPYLIAGRPQPAKGHEPTADVVDLRGDYFGAMGMRLLAGRAFTDHDDEHAASVAIVDDTLARREFAGEPSVDTVIGRQIDLDGAVRTIVGVVNHVQDRGLAERETPAIYIPQEQSNMRGALSFVLRARDGDARQLERPATATISSIDPALAATDILPMQDRVKADLAPRRAAAGLLGACAGLALILACLGIYGVISFLVARRTHEIGIRMALGATRAGVMAAVLRQGLGWAAAGAVLGAAIATRLGPAMGALVFGIAPLDPLTYAAAPAVLLLAAALACLVPARRATLVDPLEALRAE